MTNQPHLTVLALALACAMFLTSVHLTVAYSGFSGAQKFILSSQHLIFAEAEQSKTLAITATDDAIYRTGYYVLADSQTWAPFTFSQVDQNGWITSGPASAAITIPKAASTENYIIVYSCTKSGPSWDCHDNKWQIRQVNMSVTATMATIIGVNASTYHDPNKPENTLDTNFSDESRWSGAGDGAWIRYELNQTALVESVSIAFYQGTTRTSTFDIETSLDGTQWQAALVGGVSSGTSDGLERFTFTAVAARYVRILGHGSSENTWNSYREVRIADFPISEDFQTDAGKTSDTGNLVVVYYNNFEQNTIGTSDYKDDWLSCQTNAHSSIYRNGSDDKNPTNVFRQLYPSGLIGQGNGFQCVVLPTGTISSGLDEAYLSYKVKFTEGFDVLGGKMPFLEALRSLSTNDNVGICPDGTDFFMPIIMFKRNGKNPAPVFYVYYPGMWNVPYYRNIYFSKTGSYPTSCQDAMAVVGTIYGTTLPWNGTFSTGDWHTVTTRIVLNTPGQSNGFLEGFIDGKLVIQVTGMNLRSSASLKMNYLDFTGYCGGSTKEWAPVKDEYNYYDDIIVYYYAADSGQPQGFTHSAPGRTLPSIAYPSESVLD